MGLDLLDLEITTHNSDVLKKFIENLDEEKNTFRYYNTRDIDVISNHVYTVLLLLNGDPISYGHLDKEGNAVWLGILVIKEYQGKGVSKVMMDLLLKKAKMLKLDTIQLSVDKDNKKAVKLYEKYKFKLVSKFNDYVVLKRVV